MIIPLMECSELVLKAHKVRSINPIKEDAVLSSDKDLKFILPIWLIPSLFISKGRGKVPGKGGSYGINKGCD